MNHTRQRCEGASRRDAPTALRFSASVEALRDLAMAESKKLAGIIGPLLVAVIATENPLLNPNLYDSQIPPVVYLSGTLMFLGGFSVVRIHNIWSKNWPTIVTLTGWAAVVLGLVRMAFPDAYIESAGGNSPSVLIVEALLLAIGIYLTYKAYFAKISV